MFSKNPIMLKDGYSPASTVAKSLNLALSTVHRMVEDGRIEGTRVGRALYVKLKSLEDYFAGDGNETMRAEVEKLRLQQEREGAKKVAKTKQAAG